jgi:hypothetical protein
MNSERSKENKSVTAVTDPVIHPTRFNFSQTDFSLQVSSYGIKTPTVFKAAWVETEEPQS